MSQTVFCHKLQKEGARLSFPPFPGTLGQKIQDRICAEAWSLWLNHQTMLINEYRLNLMDASSRDFLQKEVDKFFFSEEGSEKPPMFSS